jgi:hypothetical protein
VFSVLDLGPNQTPVQWVPGLFWVKTTGA